VNAIVHFATSKYTYIGGLFHLAGPVAATNIARYNWDSKTWHAVAGGVDGEVNAMLHDNGMIYVGGNFAWSGNVKTKNVAVFNTATQTWSALNFGLDGTVSKLFWYGGKVTAFGAFNTGSGAQTKGNVVVNLAQWDGKRWKGLIAGFAKTFTESDTCSTHTKCSIGFGTSIKEASVVNGVLWMATSVAAPADNLWSYDGSWVAYQAAPIAYGGNVKALFPGADGKPLIQMSDSADDWRSWDQSADNFVDQKYITDGLFKTKSFGTVAQLNLVLVALAFVLVFIQ
jgi:hypothetical protein